MIEVDEVEDDGMEEGLLMNIMVDDELDMFIIKIQKSIILFENL
jgi:hypothetical protein